MSKFRSLQIILARIFLSRYPFEKGRIFFTKLLVPNLPNRSSFNFKYGKFIDVSIKKWPSGYFDLFVYGEMEKQEVYFWKKFINKGDIVIDVGANYGYWTMVASKLVGENGKVLSFEPIESTFKVLESNITASKLNNVLLYSLGLSNVNTKTTFNLSSEDEIGAQTSQGGQSIVNWDLVQNVELVTLDSIYNGKVKLVKIDIEGGELFALKGMEELLKLHQPFITFEWNVLTAEPMDYHPVDIISYLESLDYTIRIVSEDKLVDFDQELFPKERVLMLWALPKTKISVK
jgi:FkbM family methyltransferase